MEALGITIPAAKLEEKRIKRPIILQNEGSNTGNETNGMEMVIQTSCPEEAKHGQLVTYNTMNLQIFQEFLTLWQEIHKTTK